MIFLHRPIEELIKNIDLRGREMEKGISEDYLRKVQNSYFNYFRTSPDFPIIILDVGDEDLMKEENFDKILELIHSNPEKKMVWKKIDE